MAVSMSTKAFEASIGVIASPDRDGDTLSKLQYLGITSVRTELPDSTAAAAIAPYVALAKAGITFDFLPAAGGSTPAMGQVRSVLDAIEAAAPGSIASVEGPNEPNIWPITYAGLGGTAAAVQYQADLYGTVHSDPLLAGVQVYDFPFGGVGPDTYAEAGNQTASVDAANIHVYPDGLGNGAPAAAIAIERDLAQVSAPTKPMVMTEFGYSTYAGGDIDQATQARFEIDGLLDQQRLGLSKTFLYDTIDDNTGTSGYEDNFGQFASDGTPKAAGVALHNLSAILADPGSGSLPDVQAPSLSGLPSSANTLVMEKTDGTIDVAVWDESAPVHDQVSLSTAAASNVAVYDPLQSASAQQTLSAVTSATVSLGTDPLILEVKPAQAAAATAATAAASTTSPAPAPSSAAQPASVVVGLAEDAWRGNAAASIKVDGNTVGTPTVRMLQGSGQSRSYSYQPQLAAGDHTLTVTFTNDAWNGTPQTDRNLYVDHVDINGKSYPAGLPAELYRTGDTLTVPFQTA